MNITEETIRILNQLAWQYLLDYWPKHFVPLEKNDELTKKIVHIMSLAMFDAYEQGIHHCQLEMMHTRN